MKNAKRQAIKRMAIKRKGSIILRLTVIAISVYMIVTLIGLWNQLDESMSTLKDLQSQKEKIETQIEEYRALLSDDSQKAIIEKAARERFGYAYPGEEIYKEIK